MFKKMYCILIGICFLAILTFITCSKTNEPEPSDDNNSSPPATTGDFIAKVRDASNSHFIENALVKIAGKSDLTDIVGSVWIDYIPAGSYSCNVSKTGYQSHSETVTITASQTTNREIFLTPSGPTTKTVTLYATADTYVSSGSPDRNFGSFGGLYTGKTVSDYTAFVKFNILSIPSNATIDEAFLFLNTSANDTYLVNTATVTVSQVKDRNWTETGLTYLSMPNTTSYLSARIATFARNSNSYSWNASSAVRAWVTGTSSNYGLQIKASNIQDQNGPVSDYCNFYSREVSQYAGPTLKITYTE